MVGQLDGLGGHLGRVQAELGTGPADRDDPVEAPAGHDLVVVEALAEIVAVCRFTPVAKLASQAVSLALSLPTGRVSLTLPYLIRVGSCQTKLLFPPSSRCSITTSQPRPSQLLNEPSSSSSIFTEKHTLSAVSGLSGIG